jgi:hypothetical protein
MERRLLFIVGIGMLTACSGLKNPFAPSTVTVQYNVTGTAQTVGLAFTNDSGGISQQSSPVPFAYSWSNAKPGDVVNISAQIASNPDGGSIHVEIKKNGKVCQSADATGFPNTASAKCSL